MYCFNSGTSFPEKIITGGNDCEDSSVYSNPYQLSRARLLVRMPKSYQLCCVKMSRTELLCKVRVNRLKPLEGACVNTPACLSPERERERERETHDCTLDPWLNNNVVFIGPHTLVSSSWKTLIAIDKNINECPFQLRHESVASVFVCLFVCVF